TAWLAASPISSSAPAEATSVRSQSRGRSQVSVQAPRCAPSSSSVSSRSSRSSATVRAGSIGIGADRSLHAMEPEVVVVGGGAIGVSAAYELARRGARVTLLERDRLGGGCSSGNAGLVCPSHPAPLATPAALPEGLPSLPPSPSPFSL